MQEFVVLEEQLAGPVGAVDTAGAVAVGDIAVEAAEIAAAAGVAAGVAGIVAGVAVVAMQPRRAD